MSRLVPVFGILSLVTAAFPCAAVVATPASGPAGGKAELARMADARVNLKESFQRATAVRRAAATVGLAQARQLTKGIASAIASFSHTLPGFEARLSNLTGAPSAVRNQRGALTAAAPGKRSEDIVRAFLAQHGDLYGLTAADLNDLVALGDSPGGSSGLRMLRMEQQIDGRPVFQSETRFLLDRDGRLMTSLGLMVPQARSFAPKIDATRLLSPQAAVVRLLSAEGKTADPAAFTLASGNADFSGRLVLDENDDYVAGPIAARQVLFPLAPGLLVPAWSLVVFTTGDADWYAMVDAET
ncbi:MAG TPA: hypothetical protein VMM92_13480, partial [Thermoanaerobaculia bacterium]|nr:hypothetical protein [Thermoanaerobaculia bacterium]